MGESGFQNGKWFRPWARVVSKMENGFVHGKIRHLGMQERLIWYKSAHGSCKEGLKCDRNGDYHLPKGIKAKKIVKTGVQE